jgi:polar amino acid transport system permease protein
MAGSAAEPASDLVTGSAGAEALPAEFDGRRKVRRSRLTRAGLYLAFLAALVALIVFVDWQQVTTNFFQPSIAAEMFPEVLTQAARNTLIFTFFGFSGGLVFGLVLALMRLSTIRLYRWFATFYIETFRGLPALLTIMIVGFGVPIALGRGLPGTYTPGSVGLGIVAAAYMAETIRAGIEAVPRGQTEAARSLGMSHPRAMASIVIPQAFRIIIPPLTNELVLLIKDTSLLFVLGTTAATEELVKFGRDFAFSSANSTPFIVVGLVYLAITLPMTRLVAVLERHTKRAR